MSETEVRKELLERLIRISGSLEKILEELELYDFEAVNGEALVVLSRKDFISVLERYLAGEISGEDIYNWADALELRDDVDFGERDDETGDVFDLISNIANPLLKGKLSPEMVKNFVGELKR